MKILLSTPVFRPMVGGMETMADNLARHFSSRGHKVTLITPIEYGELEEMSEYKIVRNPTSKQKRKLIKQADLVFSNGASLYAVFWSFLYRKKFIWRHTGYQVSCLDGAGWYNSKKAPMSPLKSFLFHIKESSLISAIKGLIKVLALRWVAFNYAATNVAISDWMLHRQPLPNAVRIHNPFPIGKFSKTVNSKRYEYDFFFLGRLISEKGVDTFIKAFAKLCQDGKDYKLCVIGKGPERENLEKLAIKLNVEDKITFTGVLTGNALLHQINRCHIAVLPSKWEEPFGGVATELLAAKKNIIVSQDGALSELVGDAGLIFKNGDSTALYKQMKELVSNETLQRNQVAKGIERIKQFEEDKLITQYLKLFDSILKNHSPKVI